MEKTTTINFKVSNETLAAFYQIYAKLVKSFGKLTTSDAFAIIIDLYKEEENTKGEEIKPKEELGLPEAVKEVEKYIVCSENNFMTPTEVMELLEKNNVKLNFKVLSKCLQKLGAKKIKKRIENMPKFVYFVDRK